MNEFCCSRNWGIKHRHGGQIGGILFYHHNITLDFLFLPPSWKQVQLCASLLITVLLFCRLNLAFISSCSFALKFPSRTPQVPHEVREKTLESISCVLHSPEYSDATVRWRSSVWCCDTRTLLMAFGGWDGVLGGVRLWLASARRLVVHKTSAITQFSSVWASA